MQVAEQALGDLLPGWVTGERAARQGCGASAGTCCSRTAREEVLPMHFT